MRFEKGEESDAWWFADPSKAVTQLRRLAACVQRHCPVTFRPANLQIFAMKADGSVEIYNQAWEKNWGFVPFTEEEIEFMTNELKPLLLPGFAWVAEIGE